MRHYTIIYVCKRYTNEYTLLHNLTFNFIHYFSNYLKPLVVAVNLCLLAFIRDTLVFKVLHIIEWHWLSFLYNFVNYLSITAFSIYQLHLLHYLFPYVSKIHFQVISNALLFMFRQYYLVNVIVISNLQYDLFYIVLVKFVYL